MIASSSWVSVRLGRASLRLDRRVIPTLLALMVATVLVMIVNISVGEYPIPLVDVVRTVAGQPTGDQDYTFIVNTLRLPRMLIAALVGMALGVAGTLMQGVTRNPLADPSILGISQGAGLVAVVLIVVVKDAPAGLLPLATFAGALAIAALIYAVAWRGGESPLRLILVGIGLSAICSALTTLIITFGNVYDVQKALIWISGSVYARSWDEFWPLFWVLALLLPLALVQARQLNALGLGDEIARGLGSNVTARRGLLVVTAVGLAAAAVAAAGTIGFVGLMAPHLARRLVGADHSGLVPTSGMLGGLLVVAADLVGRTLVAPIELPCGLVIALLGAPFFLFLLWRQRKAL